MNDNEYHIASYVAHTLPHNSDKLSEFINAQAGLEVHATNDEGKIVFTAEGESQKSLANFTEPVKNHPDTLTLSPVYHQFLNEEQNSTSLASGEKTCIDCHKGIAHKLPDMHGVEGWQ